MAFPENVPLAGNFTGTVNPNNCLGIDQPSFASYRDHSLGMFNRGDLQPPPDSSLIGQVKKLALTNLVDPLTEWEILVCGSSSIEEFGHPIRGFRLEDRTGNVHARFPSFPDDLDKYPFRPVPVELAVENLLPRAEVQLALADRHDKGDSHRSSVNPDVDHYKSATWRWVSRLWQPWRTDSKHAALPWMVLAGDCGSHQPHNPSRRFPARPWAYFAHPAGLFH
jgi:hypothetical protein